MPFVYSTLSGTTDYCSYFNTGNNIHTVDKKVSVKGGANVAVQNKVVDMYGAPIHTPKVCETEITDEEANFLLGHPVFKIHKKNGFVEIQPKQIKSEKALTLLNARDKSSPKTPDDYKGRIKVESDGTTVIGPRISMEQKTAMATAM